MKNNKISYLFRYLDGVTVIAAGNGIPEPTSNSGLKLLCSLHGVLCYMITHSAAKCQNCRPISEYLSLRHCVKKNKNLKNILNK